MRIVVDARRPTVARDDRLDGHRTGLNDVWALPCLPRAMPEVFRQPVRIAKPLFHYRIL
jgi:hypothetical protein